jgi:dipeptidyl aminopeptidase/acylaminoacyl peptidase
VAWTTYDFSTRGSTVWAARAAGGKPRLVRRFDDDPVDQIAWDTARSLLVAHYPQLSRLSLSGRLSFVVADRAVGPFGGVFQSFSIDASRRHVAIGSDECPDPTECAGSSIRVIDLRSRTVVAQVGSPADLNYLVALSPDSRSVAYLRESLPAGELLGIWLAPVSGGGTPYQIASGAGGGQDPVWSPDGHLLAYVDDSGLWVLRVNSGTRTKIASGSEGPASAAFSPDSRFLAYDQTGRGRAVATVFNLRTGHVYLRSPPWAGNAQGQAWSPDGAKLLVTSRCGLYEANIQTRHWRTFRACHWRVRTALHRRR